MDKLLEKMNITSKKGIQNFGIFLIATIILMIVMNSFTPKKSVQQEIITTNAIHKVSEDSFEQKLEDILSTIQGIHHVSVLVAYENSIEKIPLYNTKETTTVTEETDRNGGERKTKETNNEYMVVYEENGNDKTALMKQSILPQITGIIVTAEGADSNLMQEKIVSAVMAVTGLSSNKIAVYGK